jgi:hypothetical protein
VLCCVALPAQSMLYVVHEARMTGFYMCLRLNISIELLINVISTVKLAAMTTITCNCLKMLH